MKFCRLWNGLTGNILEAPSLSHFKLDQTNDLKICSKRQGYREWMKEFFFLSPVEISSVVSAGIFSLSFCHSHTHINTNSYYLLSDFSIRSSPKQHFKTSKASFYFWVYIYYLFWSPFPSLWMRFFCSDCKILTSSPFVIFKAL